MSINGVCHLWKIVLICTAAWSVLSQKVISNVYYNFTTCNNEGRTGPTIEKCMDYYEAQQSPICDSTFNVTNGSQFFTIPVAGTYVITIAGAKGGDGVCPDSIGSGGVVMKGMLQFGKYELLRIMVGQQGRSTCFNNTASVCRGQQTSQSCGVLSIYPQMLVKNFWNIVDGGGGGGGASMIQRAFKNASLQSEPIIIAPGGGGACLHVLGCSDNVDSPCPANITIPENELIPGYGGGFYPRDNQRNVDGFSLNESGKGGMDCNSGEGVAFSDIDGGFGGGGGACQGGGGGGGWIGGRGGFSKECSTDMNITYNYHLGGVGMNYGDATTWINVGTNDGPGYVSLLLLCNCTHQCIMEGSNYNCSCPNGSFLAPDKQDCYREGMFNVEIRHTLFNQPSRYGRVNVNIFSILTDEYYEIYSLSTVVNMSQESDGCVLAIINTENGVPAFSDVLTREEANLNSHNIPFRVRPNLSASPQTFLSNPVLASFIAAISIRGGLCSLDGFAANISLKGSTTVDFAEVADLNRMLLRALNVTYTDASGNSGDDDDTAVIVGITVGCAAAVVVIIMGVVCYFVGSHRARFRNKVDLNEQRYQKSTPAVLAVSNNEVFSHGYEEIIIFGEEEGISEPKYYNTFVPKHGVRAPNVDYHRYNSVRKSTKDKKGKSWEFDRNKLVYMRELGEGQFGKVLLMRAKGGICGYNSDIPVAVKTLSSRKPEDLQKFEAEAELMKKFAHPKIVSLLGYCSASGDAAPMMILELMQYGDLENFLLSNRPDDTGHTAVTTELFYQFANNIAEALNFLAEQSYVHRDVAARNCLVGVSLTVKLADFGLAREVHDSNYYKVAGRAVLPVRWMAPESLLYGKFTTASDVWSFGVLLWEIVSFGDRPHEDLSPQEIVGKASDKTLQLPRPDMCPDDLYSIIVQCNYHQPDERPDFSSIVALLQFSTSLNDDSVRI
ncbi:leukocyte tyrosine kinase receptor-like isoform X2 [Dysidea avara]|uniref:leukocyte tyrosine kinase receptor-like isoform X2 n=1 Tax=Dysidea avara TaxID=196820 RepID=UPI003323E7FE